MISKEIIERKIDRIESELRHLNYSIGSNDRDKSYKHLDQISSLLSDITVQLNRN